MRVGFIGLGSQGAPMVGRIVDAGFPLTVWARRAETTAAFAETPAAVRNPHGLSPGQRPRVYLRCR